MPASNISPPERRVRLFRNRRNQAIRIPRAFEPGDEAILRKEGGRLVIECLPPRSLSAVLARRQPLDEDFPRTEELLTTPVDR
jgi:antitoxin VapB